MINKIKKFFQKDKTIDLLEGAVTKLEERNKELLKSIELLRKENDQWRQVSKIIDDKVKELLEKKWGDFIISASGGGLVANDYFDQFAKKGDTRHTEVLEQLSGATNRLEVLETQMKATDKVFFLADKIERLLKKYES